LQPRRITGVLYQAGAGIVHSGFSIHDPSAAVRSQGRFDMTHRTRTPTLLAALFSVALLGACALRAPSISEVQSNPGHYVDRTVTVTGVVTTSWGVPLVPYRMYRIGDGSGEILVISDGRRTPTKGARVRVRGEVEEFAVFGGRSVGLHLREKNLKVL
jgi:hypothetical protein